MAHNYEKLERASGLLFIIGSILSKLKYLPITLAKIGGNVFGLLMYLVGYLLWFAACQRYPNQKIINNHWYTFAGFKEQFSAAAIIGCVAMVFSFLAFINSMAVVAAAWLMVCSNFLWLVGERNKIENPPQYRELPSKSHQETNFSYVTIVFSISLITAFSVTGVIIFPLSAAYIASLATLLTTGLSLWSFEHIFENLFPLPENKLTSPSKPTPVPEVDPSLAKMQPQKGPANGEETIPVKKKPEKPLPNNMPEPPSCPTNKMDFKPF